MSLFSFDCACKLYLTLRSSVMLCELLSKGQKNIQHAVFGRMSSSFYKSISIRSFISRNRQILILTCRDLMHQYMTRAFTATKLVPSQWNNKILNKKTRKGLLINWQEKYHIYSFSAAKTILFLVMWCTNTALSLKGPNFNKVL